MYICAYTCSTQVCGSQSLDTAQSICFPSKVALHTSGCHKWAQFAQSLAMLHDLLCMCMCRKVYEGNVSVYSKSIETHICILTYLLALTHPKPCSLPRH